VISLPQGVKERGADPLSDERNARTPNDDLCFGSHRLLHCQPRRGDDRGRYDALQRRRPRRCRSGVLPLTTLSTSRRCPPGCCDHPLLASATFARFLAPPMDLPSLPRGDSAQLAVASKVAGNYLNNPNVLGRSSCADESLPRRSSRRDGRCPRSWGQLLQASLPLRGLPVFALI
jgi:hypothetical protein